jgi:hypothetical protein
MPEESPFHLRGYIGPQHTGAWRAMKWHEDTLRSVFRDLDRNPPEYIFVRAPALGGKTTFAMQFMDRVISAQRDIFVAYLPLGGDIVTQEDFLFQMRQSFVNGVDRLLDSMARTGIQDLILELSEALTEWNTLPCSDLDELLRGLMRKLPEHFRRVVLVLDDSDRPPEEARQQLGEAFRTIHANRPAGTLSRFSILLTARSLLRGPNAVSPLANVVKTYQLGDFTRDDLVEFLGRSEAVAGARFDPETVDYLHMKTGGQAVMLQRVLRTAIQDRPEADLLGLPDVFGAVCRCYEDGGGLVDRLLDITYLTQEARLKLAEVLDELPVLAFESEPPVAELIDLGIVRHGPNRRLICRSPLIRELYLARFLPRRELPRLTPIDELLLNLPSVLAMVMSKPLLNCVQERISKVERMGYAAHDTPETVAVEALRTSGYPLDLREVEYCYQRYYGDLCPQQIALDDVLRTVARVLVAWSDEHE